MSFIFLEILEWFYDVYYGGVLVVGVVICLGYAWDRLRKGSQDGSLSWLEAVVLPAVSLVLGLFWPLVLTFVALWVCFVGTLWLSSRIHSRAFRRARKSSP